MRFGWILILYILLYSIINHLKIYIMKNLILSAIFALVAFSNNAQVVTITVFQTADAVGSNDRSLFEILKHPDMELSVNLP